MLGRGPHGVDGHARDGDHQGLAESPEGDAPLLESGRSAKTCLMSPVNCVRRSVYIGSRPGCAGRENLLIQSSKSED